MGAPGTSAEWMRFLDVSSADEAVAALRNPIRCLEGLQQDLRIALGGLRDAPGGDLTDPLLVALHAISETLALLDSVIARFRAAEWENV